MYRAEGWGKVRDVYDYTQCIFFVNMDFVGQDVTRLVGISRIVHHPAVSVSWLSYCELDCGHVNTFDALPQ